MSVGAGKCWLVPKMAVLIVVVISMVAIQVVAQAQVENNVNEDELRLQLRSGVANVTDRIALEMQRRADFCILDEKLDWNRAFNYSNLDFLTTCMAKTEDAASRLCTEAEIRVYLGSFFDGGGLQANKNCNLSSWVAGCEPGWACSTASVQKIDLETTDKEIPARTSECKSCCEGFFCPQGLTCMMRSCITYLC